MASRWGVVMCFLAVIGQLQCHSQAYTKECGSDPMNSMSKFAAGTGRTLTRVLMMLRNINQTAYKTLAERIQNYAACVGLVDTGYFKKRSSPPVAPHGDKTDNYNVHRSETKWYDPLMESILKSEDTKLDAQNDFDDFDKWISKHVKNSASAEHFPSNVASNVAPVLDDVKVKGTGERKMREILLQESIDALRAFIMESPFIKETITKSPQTAKLAHPSQEHRAYHRQSAGEKQRLDIDPTIFDDQVGDEAWNEGLDKYLDKSKKVTDILRSITSRRR